MVDGVARQDHYRPFGRQAAIDERLGERIDAAPRLLVGDAAPCRTVALGEEQPRRLSLYGGAKQAGEARIMGSERRCGAQVDDAAGAGAGDLDRTERDWPVRRVHRRGAEPGLALAHRLSAERYVEGVSHLVNL